MLCGKTERKGGSREDFLVISEKKVYYKARKTLAKESRYDEDCRFSRWLEYGT